MKRFLLVLIMLALVACNADKSAEDKKELWIYTSMYKDTIEDLKEKLKVDFPDVKFNWYQAGSEDISAKVNGELIAGNVKADIVICSDRFWYEEMANQGRLLPYKSQGQDQVPGELKHPKDFYSTVSIPVMVLLYNNEAVKAEEAPKTYKEMADIKWKDRFTTGSPLASGTNFTTMAMLQHHYGWDYFQKLRNNNTIAQGGNSAVIRRVQNKERPVGWVLLENILRLKTNKDASKNDPRLQIIYPEDGVVTHANVMAIMKKEGDQTLAKKFTDWMYGQKGQKSMTDSFMYSPIPSFQAPEGAPPLAKLLENSFKWTTEFLKGVAEKRTTLKEKYTEIMFQ